MNTARGFTTVELIIAITVSALLSGALIAIMLTWLGGYAVTSVRATLRADNRRALTIMSDDIRSASNAVDYNQWADDNAPLTPATTLGSSPADTDQPYFWRSSTHQLILIRSPRDSSGNAIFDDATTFVGKKDNYVYYVDTSTNKLYRRTVPVPRTVYATNVLAITNCGAATTSGGCPANDFLLAQNVAKNADGTPAFNISYYNNVGTPVSGATSVRAVVINLTLSATQNGKPISITNAIRMEFRSN